MLDNATIGTISPNNGSDLIKTLEQEIEQAIEKDFASLLNLNSQPSSDELDDDDSDTALDSPSLSDSGLSTPSSTGGFSTPSSGLDPASLLGTTSLSDGAQALQALSSKLGLLSTAESDIEKASGDSNPGSNELSRLGQEAGILGKVDSLMHDLSGLMSHSIKLA